MNEFKKVCKLSDLKEDQGKRFFVDDVDVAVFLVKNEVHAISNVCPHQHASVLYDGFVEDCKVSCPVHGWEFDLKTGKLGETRRGVDVYETKIEDGEVFVKVFKKELNW